jgi:hypothetical protein
MTNSRRIRIAAVATALFLAALSAGGLALRGNQGPDAPAVTAELDQGSASTPSAESIVNAIFGVEDEQDDSDEDDDDYDSDEDDD